MNYFLSENVGNSRDAGTKPKKDIEQILESLNFVKIGIDFSISKKNFSVKLKKSLKDLKAGDVLLVQYPLKKAYIVSKECRKLKKKGINTIVVVHDLNHLRLLKPRNLNDWVNKYQWKMRDLIILKSFSLVIAHNKIMKSYIEKFKISSEKIIELGIFDYLLPTELGIQEFSKDDVIIAGNLSEEKAAFVYKLPIGSNYGLYGINYTTKDKRDNVHYYGSFDANNPSCLGGKFGLVWDGDSVHTCSGNFGEYLRYNNPYKLSMYLALGIPVLVWKESALSKFVEEQGVGIAISDLDSIPNILENMSEDDYQKFKHNATEISIKLRKGDFFKNAIKKSLTLITNS